MNIEAEKIPAQKVLRVPPNFGEYGEDYILRLLFGENNPELKKKSMLSRG